MNKIAIIGGGASGMAAAIAAARVGADVTILEKNPRIGKKILSTGNGRCNFTNINATAASYNSAFAGKALNSFSPADTVKWFSELGILAKIEDEGRAYPNSGQASAVLDVLRMEIDRLGVRVITEFDVAAAAQKKGGFEAAARDGRRIFADRLIVACGGHAAPKSGSDGSGYKLLKALGHSVTPLRPALAAIKTDRGIQGVRQRGRVTLGSGEARTGEIQFNSGALSGIPVMELSRYAEVGGTICVDLLPDFDRAEVVKMLKNRPVQPLESCLVGVLNKALGQMLLKECAVGALSRSSGSLKNHEIEKIADKIKCWRFEITGLSAWDNAQVTAGGISLDEVCAATLESRLVPGLYITGELLDIDGGCGGYNLQWAWSSGITAGGEAARVQN